MAPSLPGSDTRRSAIAWSGGEGPTDRGELYELARTEPPGDGSARLEHLLATALRQHGGAYTRLQLSAPRCTRTVCMLAATTAGTTMQDSRADWQRLSATVIGQPWFREHFDDSHLLVTHDGRGEVYLTFYVRCEPGSCLYAQ